VLFWNLDVFRLERILAVDYVIVCRNESTLKCMKACKLIQEQEQEHWYNGISKPL
jgi:hypothetical protein